MQAPSGISAIERARWLAELASALSEARAVVRELGAAEGQIEALELYARIEAARFEIETMRLRRSTGDRRETDPKGTQLPWQQGHTGTWD